MATRMELRDFDRYVKLLKQGIASQDPLILGIIVAVAVVILTIVILKIIRNKRNTGRAVLLVGLCNSGKTVLFSRLTCGEYKMTHTSIKENIDVYNVEGEKRGVLKIIDLPGHERLRNQSLDQFKDQARGVIFLIDSEAFQKEIKEVAEFLYNLCIDGVLSCNGVPFLIACNKTDATTAKSANLIKTQLEKEMNTLRITRSAALQGIDNTAGSNAYLGKRGKDFEFSDVSNCEVEFVECSCKGSKGEEDSGNIKQVQQWLYNIA